MIKLDLTDGEAIVVWHALLVANLRTQAQLRGQERDSEEAGSMVESIAKRDRLMARLDKAIGYGRDLTVYVEGQEVSLR